MNRHAPPGVPCHIVGRYPENASHLPSSKLCVMLILCLVYHIILKSRSHIIWIRFIIIQSIGKGTGKNNIASSILLHIKFFYHKKVDKI